MLEKLPVPISRKSCPVNLTWLYCCLIVTFSPCTGASLRTRFGLICHFKLYAPSTPDDVRILTTKYVTPSMP